MDRHQARSTGDLFWVSAHAGYILRFVDVDADRELGQFGFETAGETLAEARAARRRFLEKDWREV